MDKFMTKYMKCFMNIYVYSILYIIYLYFFLDTLLISPKHWFQSQWSGIFLICSAVFLSYTMIFQEKRIKLKYFLFKEISTFSIFFIFLLVFLFQSGRDFTNWEVLLSQFLLMADIYMLAKIYSKYDKKNLFLFLSFIVPTIFVIYHTQTNHIPALTLDNIKNIMQAAGRNRYAFDFNHFNTLGNLIAGIFLISFVFIGNTIKQKEWIVLKVFKILLPIVMYIPLAHILLCTGSRTSLLSLGVGTVACLYFVLTNLKFIPNLVKIIVKGVLIIAITLPTCHYLNNNFNVIMDDSNRRENYDINLPNIMNTKEKEKYGLGLIYYGDFGDKIVEGYETSNIDSYYLYLYICTGKIGLIIFIITFVLVLLVLYLNMYFNPSFESSIIVGVFIAHMVLGIGETCILYFTFLSGALLTATYIITMDEFYNHISEHPINIKNIFKKKKLKES